MNSKTLKTVLAIAAIATAGAASAQQQGFGEGDDSFSPTPVVSTLSRAEVQADLNLWNRAGLGRFADSDAYVDSSEYEQRLATYQRLRSGPAYQAEVQRLQGHAVAGDTAARNVN